MAKKKCDKFIEAGHVPGRDIVWVGVTTDMYDIAKKPITGAVMHIIKFSSSEALVVAKMLIASAKQKQRQCIESFDCSAGDHSDACPVKKHSKKTKVIK